MMNKNLFIKCTCFLFFFVYVWLLVIFTIIKKNQWVLFLEYIKFKTGLTRNNIELIIFLLYAILGIILEKCLEFFLSKIFSSVVSETEFKMIELFLF